MPALARNSSVSPIPYRYQKYLAKACGFVAGIQR